MPYVDSVTRQQIQPLTTPQIYKGAFAFIVLQLIMVAVLIAYPQLVTGSLSEKVQVDLNTIELDAGQSNWGGNTSDGGAGWGNEPARDAGGWGDSAPPPVDSPAEDPAAALMREMKNEPAPGRN